MHDAYLSHLRQIVDQVRADGFYKTERVIESPQSPEIRVNGTDGVLNLCANNYLGLADDPRLVKAAQAGARAVGLRHGLGALHLRNPNRA